MAEPTPRLGIEQRDDKVYAVRRILAALVFLSVGYGTFVTLSIVGEGEQGRVAAAPPQSTSRRQSSPPALVVEDWDAVARSMLVNLLRAGEDGAEFVRLHVQNATGCSIVYAHAGALSTRAARHEFRVDARRLGHAEGLMVGTARYEGAGMVIGVICP